MKKEIDDTRAKHIRNIFRLKKENKAIEDRIIRDIRNHFEHEEEDYYIPVRAGNFCSNNYIVYESNGDRNKTLSVEEYLNKIRQYLKDIIKDLKKSDTNSINNTAINFASSKDNCEECVMHSKSDNIEININDKADEVTEKLFEPLLNSYQIGLEISVKGSDFIFDCVHFIIVNVLK